MSNLVQMPLALGIDKGATFANFFMADNGFILQSLKQLITSEERAVFLWGEADCGKTHLLKASVNYAGEQKKTAVYLEASAITQAGALDNLEQINLICIDGLQELENDLAAQRKLFYLFNQAREFNNKLLFAARRPPANLNLNLPDLASRLSWGLILEVPTLTDAEKITALTMRAQALGLTLDKKVGEYLLRHYSRSTGSLFTALEELNRASLAARRRLTVPFVKEVLGAK